MSSQHAENADGNTPTQVLQNLDQVCDRFELAWLAGENPNIEDYIEGVDAPFRSQLLRELVALEVFDRRQRGETPVCAEYETRFTSDTATVREAFDGCSSAGQVKTETFLHSDTPSGHLDIRCPSCHAQMQVAVDTSLTELTCSSCGSHFSLVDRGQATRMAPPLSQLGRFELVERLGVGGFGSVWKAHDKELDRTVAIKIPRQGSMTAEEQERFFHEARAAAQLRHANIVSVHEVGRDGDSVYIVSDFVRGVTLGDWLTGQQLTCREAAELCAKIADALHHAHEGGVVHRDLKPANIIIDGNVEPHLMDFGLARRDADEVTITVDGQVLGTPAYMSPEQAQGEAHQADRRSDVYSLGVILFQLLTGELPFRGNARMIMHQVLHDEPPSPRKLNAHVPKDLETITLKCLEKDPARRYQSARDVGDELGHWLIGEPISARPLGPVSKTWRWANRKPMAAVVVAMVVGLAIAGPSVAIRQSQLVQGERIAHKQAATEAAKATAISGLFQDALQSANPDAAKGADYTVRRLLDDISAQLGDELQDQPEIEATIRTTIGNAYRRLDLLDDAESHLNEAIRLRRSVFAPDHAEIASSLFANAWLAYERDDWVACETLAREARAIHTKQNLQNDETVEILSLLHLVLVGQRRISEAEQVAQEVMAIARKQPGLHPEVPNVLHRSILYVLDQGDFARAEALGRESLDLHRKLHGKNHPEMAWCMAGLSAALLKQGKLDEAEAYSREALSIFRTYHDDSHSGNASAKSSLILVLREKGDQAGLAELRLEAVSRADQALTRAESQLQTLRLRKANALNDAAWEMVTTKTVEPWDLDQALTLAKEAVALTEALDGSPLPAYLDTLALAQQLTGATHEAVKTQKRAISLLDGAPTSSQVELYVRLIQFYAASGRHEDALALATDFTDKVLAAYPKDHAKAAALLAQSVRAALDEGLSAPAEVFARQCLHLRRKVFPDDHQDVWFRHNAASMLGEALALQGKFTEAEPLLLESAEWMTTDTRMPAPKQTGGEDRTREAVQRVAALYEAWHAAEPDSGYHEKAYRWFSKLGESYAGHLHYFEAVSHEIAGNSADAIASYTEAIEKEVDAEYRTRYVQVLEQLAENLKDKGDTENAAKAREEVERLK